MYQADLRVINAIAIVLCLVFVGNAPREIELHDQGAALLRAAPHALPPASFDRRNGIGDPPDGDRRSPLAVLTWSAEASPQPLVAIDCIVAAPLAPPGSIVPRPSSRGPPSHS